MAAETTAEQIVARIVSDMKGVLKKRRKKFSKGALEDWADGLRNRVQKKLDGGDDWSSSRGTVRRVAKDMARIAARLSGSKKNVDRARVIAAFRAVQEHVDCPAVSTKGRWCDFKVR